MMTCDHVCFQIFLYSLNSHGLFTTTVSQILAMYIGLLAQPRINYWYTYIETFANSLILGQKKRIPT